MFQRPVSGPKRKRLLRKPLVWTLVVVAVLGAGIVLLNRDDYEQAGLRFVARQIQEHKVWSATIKDTEQRVEITTTDGHRFHAEWETPSQARELNNALQEAQPAGGYAIEVSRTWFLLGPLGIFVGAVLFALLVVVVRRVRRLQKDR
ncbi:hypothetical protein [Microbispora sp. NPDC046933]|uniref:hypothetical protein n=1 Tax=Microbispora sp. NPDC046933 TaxID=3155618 RepID=UPI003410B79A